MTVHRVLAVGLGAHQIKQLQLRLSSGIDVQEWKVSDLADIPTADLLLVDSQASLKDSLAFVRTFQANHGRRPVPLIFCLPTAEGSEVLRQLVARLGAVRILQPPVDSEELVRHVAITLGLRVPSVPIQRQPEKMDVAKAMAGVWERHRQTNLERVETLVRFVAGPSPGVSPPTRTDAWRAAHQLSGALGTFGWEDASVLSRDIEHVLTGTAELSGEQKARLSRLVPLLPELLASTPPTLVPQAGPSPSNPTMLFLSNSEHLAVVLAEEAMLRSIRFILANSVESAQELCEAENVDVLLVDFREPGARHGLSPLAAANIPVVALAEKSDWQTRARVAGPAVTRFVEASQTPAQILEVIQEVETQARKMAPRVLVVDDDPTILSALEILLSAQKLRVYTLLDPIQFWDSLETIAPDLLILDIELPFLNGIELCRAVRTDPNWDHLPILFLSSHTDPEEVNRVYRAGADDYVAKPILGPELVTRVQNRLNRAQAFRRLSEVDSLTGVSSRRRCLDSLKQQLRMASRRAEPLTVAIIDLDHFKAVNDTYGHATGDEVLKAVGHLLLRAFRSDDVIGRWGGEEFLVGLYTMDPSHAALRLGQILAQLRSHQFTAPDGGFFNVTMSVGLAHYPQDGQELPALFRAADIALYQAKKSGRDRIVVYDAHSQVEHRHVDLAIVDDDQVLTEILVETLEARGYSVQAFHTGQSAMDALSGADPLVKARVVVLDEELPDAKGLEILPKLLESAAFQTTRVVFLTGHHDEAQVLRALDLGVHEHLSKPIALSILLRRLERALGK